MRASMMCFSTLLVPRCNIYSLVNTWCKGFSVCEPGGNNRRWSRRPVTTTTGEGRSSTLSGSANIILDEIVETRNMKVTINSDYSDVRQLISDNKDLAGLGTFIVFDLETTRFIKSGKIIEIALQDLLGGENSTFQTLVNPKCDVANSYIHGITTSMVDRCDVPRMKELIPILLQFVKSRQKPGGYVVFVAHNARKFDVPFLVNEFKQCSVDIPSNWLFLDTLPLAREAMNAGGLNVGARISLQALREHYGIELQGNAHRAMSDVHSLSLVLQKITFDLKLPISGLVQRTFTATELTVSGPTPPRKKKLTHPDPTTKKDFTKKV